MKMKILSLALLGVLINSQAFAQSAVRADEAAKHPEQYRLGDSNDLQSDQIKIDQNQMCDVNHDSNAQKHQQNILKKHLIKNSDYI